MQMFNKIWNSQLCLQGETSIAMELFSVSRAGDRFKDYTGVCVYIYISAGKKYTWYIYFDKGMY